MPSNNNWCLSRTFSKCLLMKSQVAHRCPQHLNALLQSWHLRPTPHLCSRLRNFRDPLQLIAKSWFGASKVPNVGLALVNSDLCMSPQFSFHGQIPFSDFVRLRYKVYVVQESHHHVTGASSLKSFQRWVLAQGEEKGHERIPLLSSFAL